MRFKAGDLEEKYHNSKAQEGWICLLGHCIDDLRHHDMEISDYVTNVLSIVSVFV